MHGLPIALALSIALWALIVELAVGLMTVIDGLPVASAVTEIAAVAPALMGGAVP